MAVARDMVSNVTTPVKSIVPWIGAPIATLLNSPNTARARTIVFESIVAFIMFYKGPRPTRKNFGNLKIVSRGALRK